jgi:hypothetical protein
MKLKSLFLSSLFILAACAPVATPTVAPSVMSTSTPISPTATSIPPAETPIPPTATVIPEFERLSPTAIRIKDAVISADATLTPEKFELIFNNSIPNASAGKVDPSVKHTTFEFPDGPVLVLTPNYGGGGGGGGDTQGNETGAAIQGYLVKSHLQSGQLFHLIVYATFDPSTGLTEPVPFEFYLLMQ